MLSPEAAAEARLAGCGRIRLVTGPDADRADALCRRRPGVAAVR
jgi:hypothetical protein